MSDNSSSKRKKIGIVPGVILCACQFLIAVLVLCSFSMATSGFRGYGITMGLLLGCGLTIFVFPVTLLIVMLLVNLQQKYTLPDWANGRAFVVIGFLVICFALYAGLEAGNEHKNLEFKNLKLQISDVEVEGFNSFLGSRWLYSFTANNTDVIALSEYYELETFDGINLKKSLERDSNFKDKNLDILKGVPGEESTLAFAKSSGTIPSKWVTLVYSASLKRAWLYIGYQN